MDNSTVYNGVRLGEGALGGMIPTSIMILLVAIIRMIKIYLERRQYKLQTDTAMTS